jgi:hypothetical protein
MALSEWPDFIHDPRNIKFLVQKGYSNFLRDLLLLHIDTKLIELFKWFNFIELADYHEIAICYLLEQYSGQDWFIIRHVLLFGCSDHLS